MRKITGWVMAVGLVVAVVAGCGTPSKRDMMNKLQSEAESLDTSNYKSQATMTVQMDNNSQTYYIETWYEAPDVYRISLGDENKNINQIIVHNKNGMFIVSPSLSKVFRFNGNWAQNQGHIYLYDQILQQLAQGKNVKMTKSGDQYLFEMPLSATNDVVVKEKVILAAGSLHPKSVVLYDKDDKAVVSINFTSFKSGVKFNTTADFDPHKLVAEKTATTTTVSQQQANFGYVEPNETLGDKLAGIAYPEEQDDTLLRYTGVHGFTLDEWRPNVGVDGFVNAQLVDLFGVPAMYTGGDHAHQLLWLNNGVEFALTSASLTLDQMREVAISTFGQSGK